MSPAKYYFRRFPFPGCSCCPYPALGHLEGGNAASSRGHANRLGSALLTFGVADRWQERRHVVSPRPGRGGGERRPGGVRRVSGGAAASVAPAVGASSPPCAAAPPGCHRRGEPPRGHTGRFLGGPRVARRVRRRRPPNVTVCQRSVADRQARCERAAAAGLQAADAARAARALIQRRQQPLWAKVLGPPWLAQGTDGGRSGELIFWPLGAGGAGGGQLGT